MKAIRIYPDGFLFCDFLFGIEKIQGAIVYLRYREFVFMVMCERRKKEIDCVPLL